MYGLRRNESGVLGMAGGQSNHYMSKLQYVKVISFVFSSSHLFIRLLARESPRLETSPPTAAAQGQPPPASAPPQL
jgi:hypothetical protein